MSFELLPVEEKKRRLENYLRAVRRDRRRSTVVLWTGAFAGVAAIVTSIVMRWPAWVIAGLPLVIMAAINSTWHRVVGFGAYAELARLDIRCPHCGKALHSEGLRGSAAKREIDSVATGFCPHCFGRLATTMADLPEAMLANLPQAVRKHLDA